MAEVPIEPEKNNKANKEPINKSPLNTKMEAKDITLITSSIRSIRGGKIAKKSVVGD